jgi:hypothetical protein
MKQTFYELKSLFIDTLEKLQGRNKRIFAAQIAINLGKGGQSLVAKEFKMARDTIRKATAEIQTGVPIEDAFHLRHRKRAEEHLPNLLTDLKSVVDSQSQADPDFQTNRLYTRLTLSVIRQQLIEKKGYTDEELPSIVTINKRLHEMGYNMKKVRKTKPLKKDTGN